MDFVMEAHKLGVKGGAFYAVCLDAFARSVLSASEQLALYLEGGFKNIGRMKIRKAVAESSGMSSWDELIAKAEEILTNYAPPARGSRPMPPADFLASLIPILPILIKTERDLPPTKEELNGFTALANKLAKALNIKESEVMDVLARMNGADNFAKLCARKASDSPLPLYGFEENQYGENSGSFTTSAACESMIEELDRVWQGFDGFEPGQKQIAIKHIERVVSERPDFLEGLLAQATIKEDMGDHKAAGEIFQTAITKAEELIPKGFKGEISWYGLGNRFYHRLLYNYMRWHIVHGVGSKAVALARKQLKLNKSDNLGVRFDLPTMLAQLGDYKGTMTALNRLLKNDSYLDAHTFIVVSVCHMNFGEMKPGIEYFLKALFVFPAIRTLITDQKLPDDFRDEKRKWHRGVIPDIDSMWFQFQTVTLDEPQIEDIYKQVLNYSIVKQAESELATAYHAAMEEIRGNFNPTENSLSLWNKDAMRRAETLAVSIMDKK